MAFLEKLKRVILDSCANDSSYDAFSRLVFGKSPLPSNWNITKDGLIYCLLLLVESEAYHLV